MSNDCPTSIFIDNFVGQPQRTKEKEQRNIFLAIN
jgi:hypothetical protein